MMWNELKNNTEIDRLVERYGNFHDSCLRDIYISTREFVDEKLAMHFENKLTAFLLFQRQYKPDTVLELLFEDLIDIDYSPLDEHTGAVIYGAQLTNSNETFVFKDCHDDPDYHTIKIRSKRLYYRFRPELIGNVNRINTL